jgi:uncharacterized protein YndB with AHSA1/START domain
MAQTEPQASKAVRAHETRIEIDAPIEDVWRALTEAREIQRWFAPKMTVEAGAGGSMLADWGPGLEWKNVIEVWEPNRHLRLAETRDHMLTPPGVTEKMGSCRLVQDYYLEAVGGKTVLRLVHSGFGSSSDWDNEYEGTRSGWAVCFLRLKYGLERHRRDTVRNFILTSVCPGVDYTQALQRVESVAPQPMEIVFRSDRSICGLLPALNGSILSVSVAPAATGSLAYVEVLLFGLPEAQNAEVEKQWREKLTKLFPPQSHD